MKENLSSYRIILGILAVIWATLSSSQAAGPYYWDNNGTTGGFGDAGGTWGSSANLSTDATGVAAPGSPTTASAETLYFGGASLGLTSGTINVNGIQNIGVLTFGAASTGVITLSGGTIAFSGTPTINLANSHAISSTITSATKLVITGSGTLTLTGASSSISGGSTSYIQSGANVYLNGGGITFDYLRFQNTSTLTVNSGSSFTVITGLAVGNGGTGNNVVQNGGTVNYTGTTSGNFRIGHNGAGSYVISGGDLTATNSSTSTEICISNGQPGTLTISGGNVFATKIRFDGSTGNGTLNMNSGTLTVGALGIANNGASTPMHAINLAGGTIKSSTAWSSSLPMNIANTGSGIIFDTTSGTITLSGTLSGSGGLTKSGTGILSLSGTLAYAGNTTVNGGTLSLGSAGSTLAASSSVSIGAGAMFDVSGLGASANYTLGASATLTASGSGTTLGTTAAAIKGGASGTVALGARPITLNLTPGASPDTTHPALYISQGALNLGGNQFTVNAASLLAAGTYRIIQVGNGTSGTITDGGGYPSVTGTALGSSRSGAISVSSGNVVLTVTGPYNVTYNGNGSDGGTEPTDGTDYAPNASVTVQGAGGMTRTGYTFTGWNTLAGGGGTPYSAGGALTITGNTTLYAQWTINSYTITASAGANGSISPPGGTSVSYGGSQAYTISPAAHYHVADVLVDSVSQGAIGSYSFTGVSAAHSISATFAIDTCTVAYNNNGGTGSQTDPSSPYNYNSTVTVLSTGSMARDGYAFVNWNTQSAGGGASYSEGNTFAITANTTLYAQWILAGNLAKKLVITSPPVAATAGVASGSITVQRQDDSGTPVTTDNDITVTLLSDSTGTTTFTPASVTIPSGSSSATFTYTDTKAGMPTVTVASAGLASGSQPETITHASASQVAFTTQPSASTAVNTAFATQPVVTIEDQYGNAVTSGGDSAVSVTLSLTAGTGVLGGTKTMSAVAGVANFAGKDLNIEQIGSDKVLTATATVSAGQRTATTSAFTITHAAASEVVFTTQPSASTVAGVAFATQPVVTIKDQYGNVVTTGSDATKTVTLSMASGSGSLGGTVSLAAVAGVADFTGRNLNINLVGSDKALRATVTIDAAGEITVTTDPAFTITHASASQMAFTTQSSASTVAGVAFATQPVVTIEDQYGNVVTSGGDSTVSVTLSLSMGTGALGGTTTMNAVAGVADFAGKGLNINLIGVNKVLRASATVGAGSITATTSPAFTITHAAASQVVFTTQPSASSAMNVPFAQQPVVTIKDQYGNVVSTGADATRTVTVTLTTGTGSLGGTTSMSASAGVADFLGKGLMISSSGFNKVLTALATVTAGSKTATTSPAFTITPTGTSINPNLNLTIVDGDEYILPWDGGTYVVGNWNTKGATLNQTGGSIANDIASGVYGSPPGYGIGLDLGGYGTNNMSGGTLNLSGLNGGNSVYAFRVGGGTSSAYGEFNLSGTAVADIGAMSIGVGAATSGKVTLSGGARLTVGRLGYVGNWDAAGIGNGYISFTYGSAATLTITTATDFSALVAAGKIRIGGATANWDQFTLTGNTLALAPPPTKLAITSVNGGSNPTAGVPFSITVTAEDSDGTPRTVSVSTNVTISLNTGNGIVGGTVSGSIAANNSSVTISGVTYTKAESGVILTAANIGGGLTSGNSVPVTVNLGAVSDSASTVVAAPGSVPADGETATTITVTLKDICGNLISGKVVMLESSRVGMDSIMPASGTSDGAGVVTFTVTSGSAGTPIFSATDTTDSLPVGSVTVTCTAISGSVFTIR